MDRRWMTSNRSGGEYDNGVREFVSQAEAFAKANGETSSLCPCKRCWNLKRVQVSKLREHLIINGIDPSYTKWQWHGEREPFSENEKFVSMVDCVDETKCPKILNKLKEDAETPLYPGCTNFTRLSAAWKLYNLKFDNRWTDASFTSLLKLLKNIFPKDNELPRDADEVKDMWSAMGIIYKKKVGGSLTVEEFEKRLPERVKARVDKYLKNVDIPPQTQSPHKPPSIDIEVDFSPCPRESQPPESFEDIPEVGSHTESDAGNKKLKLNKTTGVIVDNIPSAILRSLPKACKSLAQYYSFMESSYAIPVDLSLSGIDYELSISKEDVLQLFSMDSLNCSVIELYIQYLREFCRQRGCTQTFGFLYPSIMREGKTVQRRADYASMHMTAENKTCYLVPYIAGENWMLCVIYPKEKHAYWLDPLGLGKGVPKDLKQIIDEALVAYHTISGIKKDSCEHNTQWSEVKCPMQPGNTKCGFYVMTYMRDIIIGLSNKVEMIGQCFHGTNPYNQEQIDQLRDQWADHFQEYSIGSGSSTSHGMSNEG